MYFLLFLLVLIERTGQEAQCWDCICVRVYACVDVDQCLFLVCQIFDGNEAVLCVCGDVGDGLLFKILFVYSNSSAYLGGFRV